MDGVGINEEIIRRHIAFQEGGCFFVPLAIKTIGRVGLVIRAKVRLK